MCARGRDDGGGAQLRVACAGTWRELDVGVDSGAKQWTRPFQCSIRRRLHSHNRSARPPPVAAPSSPVIAPAVPPPGPLSGLPGGMRPGGNSGFPMSPSETMSLPGQPPQPFSPPPPSSVPSPGMSLPSVPASPPASAPATSSTSCPRDQGCLVGRWFADRIRRFRLTIHAGRRRSREVRASGCQRRAACYVAARKGESSMRVPEPFSPLTREHERAAPGSHFPARSPSEHTSFVD